MQKEHELVLVRPDRPARSLAEVAAEDVEAPAILREVHLSRLVRGQLEAGPREHVAHAVVRPHQSCGSSVTEWFTIRSPSAGA
jgi:hypothetical protein